MPHGNARLTFHGRCLLVRRVRWLYRPVAHVAKELGISRQCAHRWVARYDNEGWAGLHDRTSHPRTRPGQHSAVTEQRVITSRQRLRQGPHPIAADTGIPARTVTRILRRHGLPRLCECDPLTGQPIRASRHSHRRYERDQPGDLLHLDVKKIGRIPDGGGWRAHGRSEQVRGRGVGYDYVHAAVDDHTRLAYAEVLPDEKGTTCAGFLRRAAGWFAQHGIPTIGRVLTDNAPSYRHSHAFGAAAAEIGASQRFTRPHCPWTNGKVERFNRTLQTEWAYRHVFTSNTQRTHALGPWLHHYNTQRPHTALNGHPPTSRLTPT
ncbi:IS481 family transposase [Saccharopolyspora sp. NPDC049426]|uniref:IS481 family transposase n=1 Tax=Saccharopolyspora sp. NPDC049426 TaxID=3155652 RepID=UPI0034150F99